MNRRRPDKLINHTLLTLLIVLAGAGCTEPGTATETPEGTVLAAGASDLGPDALPYEKAHILIEGTAILVDVVREDHDDRVRFNFLVGDSTVESEEYLSTPRQFALVSTAENRFSPPLPLVRYPLRDAQTWSWTGEIIGGTATAAQASLVAHAESLHLDGGIHPAIRVSVALELTDADGELITRDLSFWFSPGNGLIQRSFGTSSKRLPVPASLDWDD